MPNESDFPSILENLFFSSLLISATPTEFYLWLLNHLGESNLEKNYIFFKCTFINPFQDYFMPQLLTTYSEFSSPSFGHFYLLGNSSFLFVCLISDNKCALLIWKGKRSSHGFLIRRPTFKIILYHFHSGVTLVDGM